MTRSAIDVAELGKQYRIGGPAEGYRTLRETLQATAGNAWKTLRNGRRRSRRGGLFWALREVSFRVEPGEVLGVIGRNGAGKSTLLKILSGITPPTAGRVELLGRVGSLLEVGTGFHPELTGRENIFLNGAILGMSRREIRAKFDEIVAFAEIERFLDTPVKRYSSGMYVRLAFAVAAHVEPEILLVDEVLAVGDAAFQKKCLGRMRDVSRGGRTVLFVSHNAAAVEALCSRCLLIQEGRLVDDGPPRQVLARYLAATGREAGDRRDLRTAAGRTRGSRTLLTEAVLRDAGGQPTSAVAMGSPLVVEVAFEAAQGALRPALGIVLKTVHGLALFGLNNRNSSDPEFHRPARSGRVRCAFDKLPLMPGTYFLDLYLGEQQDTARDLDVVEEALSFDVLPADVFGTGQLPPAAAGPVWWPGRWSLAPAAVEER